MARPGTFPGRYTPPVRRRARRWIKIVGFTVLAVLALVVAFLPMSLACGVASVRVSGRLVDGDTGSPLTGAFVMCFPDRTWTEDSERVERHRRSIEECALVAAENHERLPWHFLAPRTVGGAHTASDGTFRFVVGFGTSRLHTLIGLVVSSERPSPGESCSVLRVEVPGKRPVLLDLDPRGWRHPPAEGDAERFWGTYDLGTLRVESGD